MKLKKHDSQGFKCLMIVDARVHRFRLQRYDKVFEYAIDINIFLNYFLTLIHYTNENSGINHCIETYCMNNYF